MAKETPRPELKKVKLPPMFSDDFEIRNPRILFFDIETAPNLSMVWGHYEQNVLAHVREWYLLAWCAKWIDDKPISRSLPDYKGYKPGSDNDRELTKELWHLLDKADVVVAHNGNSFDIKKMNARFIVHGLGPPSPYITIDTKLVAKRYFRFNSNKLDDLGNTLGVGRKVKHSGFDLWQGCMNGDEKSWSIMVKYNRQDVLLLERVYLKLLPFMLAGPNQNVLMNRVHGCPKIGCGSTDLIRRGFRYTSTGKYPNFQCKKCGGYSIGRHTKTAEIR